MHVLTKGMLWLGLLASVVACQPERDILPEATPKNTNTLTGDWALGRIRFSGFPAPYELENGDIDPAQYGLEERIRLHADSTFQVTQRTGAIRDYDGTWKFAGTDLKLHYSQGMQEKLVFSSTKNAAQLVSSAYTERDTLVNPATKTPEVVTYQVQFVYERR